MYAVTNQFLKLIWKTFSENDFSVASGASPRAGESISSTSPEGWVSIGTRAVATLAVGSLAYYLLHRQGPQEPKPHMGASIERLFSPATLGIVTLMLIDCVYIIACGVWLIRRAASNP